MEKYNVWFYFLGTKQKEVVEAETLFKARDFVIEKYGKGNVEISVIASQNNEW